MTRSCKNYKINKKCDPTFKKMVDNLARDYGLEEDYFD